MKTELFILQLRSVEGICDDLNNLLCNIPMTEAQKAIIQISRIHLDDARISFSELADRLELDLEIK